MVVDEMMGEGKKAYTQRSTNCLIYNTHGARDVWSVRDLTSRRDYVKLTEANCHEHDNRRPEEVY